MIAGDPAAQAAQLAARIEAIYQAWNAQSPNCRFQRYFYNLVDPATVSRYGRPPNAFDETAWQKAVAENPDPSCLVPVLAVGFDDLAQRVEAQTQQSAAHTQTLDDLRKRLTALHTAHTTASAPRLARAAQAQAQIAHRLRALVQHLHLLIPTLRASALRPEEEALRAALDALDEEIRGARGGGGFGSMGRLRTRLNELWALLGAVSAARERDSRSGSTKVGWKVVDEDGLRELAGVLGEQQAGLAHLTKVLQKDLRDLTVIEGREVRDENGHIKEGGLGASVVGR
jgi:nuclear pore complex protein Nup54